jgi:hypothetical protein
MTANEIRRFLSGLGRIEVAYYADQMVQAGVLVRQRSGRTQRYAIPAPERPIMEPEGQVQT